MNSESKSGKAKFYILFLACGSLVSLYCMYVVSLKVIEPIDVVK